MPLSEFHPLGTKEKQPKMANCSSDMSYMNDEFVELLWDNGPVVMQGQSNKHRKRSFRTVFAPCGSRVHEKDGKDNPFPKIGHFRAIDAKSNNLPLSGSSPGIGITSQDDNDIVPWINYPIDESLHNDYFPEFLNDYSGVNTNMNAIHSQNNTISAIRSSISDEAVRNSHNVEQLHASETSRTRPRLNGAIPSTKSSELNIGCKGQENGVMNFSQFSRPVALARANLQDVDRLKNDKATVVTSNNPTESPAVEATSGLKSVIRTRDQPKELILDEQSKVKGDICKKNSNHNTINTYSRSSEKIQSSNCEASVALGMHETDKGNETAIASSSMFSDSSAGTTSYEHNKERGKREHHEGEESGYLSEDEQDRKSKVFEDEQDREAESVDLKKHATFQGKSKRRSRAAEVHNLSERRRRDRINEKMCALQELIPNCNKMDKASMLDEAIEYLKSLQMQVQIMSTGSGLCMPPMIMQHVQAPAMAHFSPLGIRTGMGMGLGYGMGMYGMNGSPFIHVPPIQGPQFPCPSGYHSLPGSNGLQMFGTPAQGFPVPTYCRPPSATNSEDLHQQKKTLEKTQRSNTDTFQIQSTKAGKDCIKNSSTEKLTDQPSLDSS